jgi:hypothetical protein
LGILYRLVVGRDESTFGFALGQDAPGLERGRGPVGAAAVEPLFVPDLSGGLVIVNAGTDELDQRRSGRSDRACSSSRCRLGRRSASAWRSAAPVCRSFAASIRSIAAASRSLAATFRRCSALTRALTRKSTVQSRFLSVPSRPVTVSPRRQSICGRCGIVGAGEERTQVGGHVAAHGVTVSLFRLSVTLGGDAAQHLRIDVDIDAFRGAGVGQSVSMVRHLVAEISRVVAFARRLIPQPRKTQLALSVIAWVVRHCVSAPLVAGRT